MLIKSWFDWLYPNLKLFLEKKVCSSLPQYSQCGCYYTSTNGYTYISGTVDNTQGHLEINREITRHGNEEIIKNFAPIIQVMLLNLNALNYNNSF